MNPLTTNLPLTGITNPLAPKLKANATTANATSSTSTSGSPTDASNIGSTFLSLLTQELQNQDPTAPMDSTAMVGQMISLNQLSQLVSMNQTLSNLSGASTTNSATGSALNTNAAAAASMQNAAGSASTLAMMFPSSQLNTLQTNGVGKTGL